MKRTLLILSGLLLCAIQASATPAKDTLTISLITCTEGNDLSSAFGHSAIRVRNSVRGTDHVYNYGTFSFYEPGFMLKFMRGDLNYFLSISEFHRFTDSYRRAGRGIVEQTLRLTPEQKADIYAFLIHNSAPQNRYYLYDFLQDNCATRIRDILDARDSFSVTDTLTDLTYRKELIRMTGDKRWLMYGIDLILGEGIDTCITVREATFLPDRLSQILPLYTNHALADSSGSLSSAALTGDPVLILPQAEDSSSAFSKFLGRLFSPISVTLMLLAAYLLAFFLSNRSCRFKVANSAGTVLYILFGIGGLIVCFLWFGTNHVWTKCNWNLLWLNPLYFVPVFLRNGRVKDIFIYSLTAVSCIPLLPWIIPQSFSPATYVLLLLNLIITITRRMSRPRPHTS